MMLLSSGTIFKSLELFAGHGQWSKSLAQKNWQTIVRDILIDSTHNVLHQTEQLFIDKHIALMDAVHFGLCCRTYSLAAHPPYRSPKHLRGLPTLSPKKRRRVDDADRMLQLVVAWILICVRAGIAVSLENPLTSYVWRHPTLQVLMKSVSDNGPLYVVKTCYCMWGRRFKKPTAILCNYSELCHIARRCPHEKHSVKLQGNLTGRLGNPYPEAMCNAWSEALCLRAAVRRG